MKVSIAVGSWGLKRGEEASINGQMAVLVREEIKTLVRKGELGFTPELDEFQLQGHSVDLRLGWTFMVPRLWEIKKEGRVALTSDKFGKVKNGFDSIILKKGQYFEILPEEYVVVLTMEKIKMPGSVMGVLYPRSSVNRRGLSLDLTGIVDAGYEGNLMIPVRNNTRTQVIRVYPGERFCQIVFYPLSEETVMEKSRYHGKNITDGVLPERSQEEIEMIKKGEIGKLKVKFKLK